MKTEILTDPVHLEHQKEAFREQIRRIEQEIRDRQAAVKRWRETIDNITKMGFYVQEIESNIK